MQRYIKYPDLHLFTSIFKNLNEYTGQDNRTAHCVVLSVSAIGAVHILVYCEQSLFIQKCLFIVVESALVLTYYPCIVISK